MNTGEGIFLIGEDGMRVLERRPFDAEAILQQALAMYPAVLAGGMTAREGDRRLLLVRQEMGVPKAEGAGPTWSLDHLFLDPSGVPVIVEVKRSSDSRIRREVVGQMLDYAANGVRYWPVNELRRLVDDAAQVDGRSGDEVVEEFQPEMTPDEFWAAVGANLSAGRVRMVFVADELPDELIAIIEFLNEQMSPAEVLGVAVPQFVGEGVQVLVPSLVGRTATAVAAKQYSATGPAWDEERYLDAATTWRTSAQVQLIRTMFEHVHFAGQFSWGKATSPGVSGWYTVGGTPTPVFTVNAGALNATGRPLLKILLPGMKDRLSPGAFERFTDRLSQSQFLRAQVLESLAERSAKKQPSYFLDGDAAAAEGVQSMLAAIDQLIRETH